MIKEFSSLHNHTHFSMMDGITLPEELVLKAKERGIKSVAVTDHGHAHAHADVYLFGKKHNVRTILGCEAYVIHDLDEWKDLKERIDIEKKLGRERDGNDAGNDADEEKIGKENARMLRRKGHLVLLASSQKGLSNLYKTIYKAHSEGFYSKPRMDKKILSDHSEGLIASSACMGGVVSNKCWEFKDGRCDWNDVVREAFDFDSAFGRGRFFLELQFNESPSQIFINECMVKISKETGIPLTVATDSHYVDREDWRTQELLYMLRGNKTVATRGDDWRFDVKQLYLKGPYDMWNSYVAFGDGVDERTAIEAFENTLLIDSLIEDFDPDTQTRLPTLQHEDSFRELGERAIAGLRKLGLAEKEVYKTRLLHELSIIKEKGFSKYFIILDNVINEAKKSQLVGAGRGSSAASLVCYCTGVTDLDPIEHDLMFERFLDPSRVELPDVDVDFMDVDAAKDMLRRMFGHDNVACLSSYGTFQIKGLLKDVGRVYDVDHKLINNVNKKIQSELRVLYKNQDKSTIVITLEDVQRVSPTFNDFVEKYPDVGQHLKRLYGRNRHVSRHAAGVIIGDDLPSETAVFTSKGVVQASFTEGIVNKNISKMGFVKFDILSIATLKVIDHALKLIADRTGKSYDELYESIRPHVMDMNDINVMEHVFWKGNFAGIFQFTEKGIRRLAKNVKPDSFVDVSAIASLYRPGPLGSKMDRLYVKNKRDPDSIEYDHPILENILSKTRGCLVFQEQLMKVCRELGKMSWDDVQRVRKVLLKKDKSKTPEFLAKENEELKGKFVDGCIENGMDVDDADKWWKNLLYFGGYGFNAAHSHAYAVMTMQCAHLATYYPLEFYSAVLTCAKVAELESFVGDIKRAKVKILPIDVNKSRVEHVIEKMPNGNEGIRLALSSVHGVGDKAAQKIVANQPYENFLDFLRRSGASKSAIHPLILVGAFDSLWEKTDDGGLGLGKASIAALEARYEVYVANPKLKNKKNQDEWEELFYSIKKEDYELHEKVFFENSLMGFSLRGSPFEILDRKKKIKTLFGASLMSYDEFVKSDDESTMLPVVVRDVRERAQRNGQMMAFLKFETIDGDEFDSPCFATLWKHLSHRVKKGSAYVVMFNRKEDDPLNLIVGRPGWAQTAHSAETSFIDVDEIEF